MNLSWTKAIKGFLIALPQLVTLIAPLVRFLTELLGPKPEKKAAELGDYLRLHAEANETEDLEEKKRKKREALKKLSEFSHRN